MVESILALGLALSLFVVVGYKVYKRVERNIEEVKMTRSIVDGEARSTPSQKAKAERDLRARRATTFWAGL